MTSDEKDVKTNIDHDCFLQEASCQLENEITLSYGWTGVLTDEKNPPCLLVHGWLDSRHSFDLLCPLLRQKNIVSVSLRGWGLSDKPKGSYTIRQYAMDIVLFLKAMKIKRCHYIGHSMGSIIGHYLASSSSSSSSFISLILIGSAPKVGSDIKRISCCFSYCCCCCSLFSSHSLLRMIQEVDNLVKGKLIPPKFAEQVMTETYRSNPMVIESSLKGLADDDHSSQLKNIRIPTLILWGVNDSMFSRSAQDQLVKDIPGSKLEIFHGSGAVHAVIWTMPEAVAEKINKFLLDVQTE